MNGINLLKYHDKSFSDIHRLMHGEIEDELFTQLVLAPAQNKTRPKPRRLLSPVYAAALLLTLSAGAVSYFYYNTGTAPADLIRPAAEKPTADGAVPPPKTRLEREGYTKIGEIVFLDENAEETTVVIKSEYVPEPEPEQGAVSEPPAVAVKSLDVTTEPLPRKTAIARGTYVAVGREESRAVGSNPPVETKKEEPKPAAAPAPKPEPVKTQPAPKPAEQPKPAEVRKAPEPQKPAAAQKEPAGQPEAPKPAPAKIAALPVSIPEKIYSIEFENVNSAKRYTILANAERAGLKGTEKLVSSSETTAWRVYRLVPGSKTQIAGRGVEFVADLSDKEQAIEFVQKNNIPAAIKQVKIENSVYNITVCCTTAEKARNFVSYNKANAENTRLVPSTDKSN